MNNRADSVYFWNVRARITKFDIADSALLAPEKAVKILTKAQKKSTGSREMKTLLEKAIGKKAKSENDVTMLPALVEMGHTDLIGDNQWKVGVYTSANRKGYSVLLVDEVLPPSLKAQMEARGYYLNEYQNELERNLCDSLREKYNVKINWDVVDQIRY